MQIHRREWLIKTKLWLFSLNILPALLFYGWWLKIAPIRDVCVGIILSVAGQMIFSSAITATTAVVKLLYPKSLGQQLKLNMIDFPLPRSLRYYHIITGCSELTSNQLLPVCNVRWCLVPLKSPEIFLHELNENDFLSFILTYNFIFACMQVCHIIPA